MHISPVLRRIAILGAAGALVAATSAGAAVASTATHPHPGHVAPLAKTIGMHAKQVCGRPTQPGIASCFAQIMVPNKGVSNPATSGPSASALTPAQLRSAYNLNGTSSGGRTVAIVDAYGYPNLQRDLGVYRTQFNLPACTTSNGCLRIINQSGGTTLPGFNVGWAGETALDVDAVSAACPDCKILVVEASSASIANLATAANTAAKQPGVVAISNSYGSSGDISDATYGSYYNHPGIAVTASTGDNGYKGPSYPASSAYVTAVGGTSLSSANNARGWSESAWSGAGSGCSSLNAAVAPLSFNTGCSGRALADVSAVADPNSGGLAVYWPTSRSNSTWAQVGGTSESSPIIAAVYALSGNTSGTANAIPYGHASLLNDITSGSTGTCPTVQWCTAGTGWDGPTGLGTPNGVGAF